VQRKREGLLHVGDGATQVTYHVLDDRIRQAR
jgi:hypothetical protein